MRGTRFLLALALSWAATLQAEPEESGFGRVKEFEITLRLKGEGTQGRLATDSPAELASHKEERYEHRAKSTVDEKEQLLPLENGSEDSPGSFGSIDDKKAWDFLNEQVSFPGGDTCGSWAEEYKALHSRITSGKETNPRYLVHYGIEGLSNRLSGIMTALMTAVLTSRAILIQDDLLPLGFEPSEVDWRVPAGMEDRVRLTEVQLNPEIPRGVNDSRKDSELDFFRYWITRDPDYPWDAKAVFDRPELEVVKMSTNRNSVNKILHTENTSPTAAALRELGITMENAHSCMLKFLLKPRRQVMAPLVPYAERLRISGKPSMCFHIRIWDYTAWNWKGELTNSEIDDKTKQKLVSALNCANKVLETLPDESKAQVQKEGVTWLVLSNWPPVVKESKRMYPQRVVESPVKPRHIVLDSNKTAAMESAVQDWLLFSLCDYYFLSNSGFSKTAMAYSSIRKGVFKTPLYNPTPWKEPDGPGPKCSAGNSFRMDELF